jgi:molecular chaperone HtpG
MRRQIESQDTFEPAINVITNQAKGTLIIEDNGAGLTREEIMNYLATVGSGYTRLLRDQQADETMIGYFGLGFLSAYVVAKRLEVWTTSYQEPENGWYFLSKGAERYSIEYIEPRSIGMRVVLHLSDNFQELADAFIIEKLLQRYCCLLPVPIYLNNNKEEPVNEEPPPWRLEQQQAISPIQLKKRRLKFAQSFENAFEPLCTIPVHPTEESEAKGLLWIQDTSTYGTSDNRNLTVFVRNMLISQDVREMLPVWAGFVGGVIESDQLTPTASREDVQKDQTYGMIQLQLNEALVEGLAKMARHDLTTWRRLLQRHNEALLGAALCDDRLFQVLAKDLKVPTSDGDLTLPVINGRGHNKIYVSIGEEGSYEEVIFRALMIPIVSGIRYAALPFCQRYTEMFGGKVVKLGTHSGNATIFKKEKINVADQEKLQSLLAQAEQKVIPSRFQPSHLPMVLMPDREYQTKKRLESEEADRRISTAALNLARIYTKEVQGETSAYLYVNLDSPIIQRLLITEGNTQQLIANLLRSLTMMMIRHHDAELGTDLSKSLATFSDSIIQLLENVDNHK